RRAGIRGTSALGMRDCADTRSAEWRAAWLACEREWRAIAFPEGQPTERAGTRSRQPYGRSSKITAAVLWHAYQCGERQKEIARRYSVSASSVCKRSQRLGFRLRYRPGTSGPPQIVAGPCLECGRPRPVEAL